MPIYRAAEYLRLSYSSDQSRESDSIGNQKKLIEDFLTGHPEIQLVSEHADDGVSGVIFTRPGFQAMMQEIMDGKVNCVIVKDLSRLGREYIETGRYLRRTFPQFGVRFISINDNIDTANERVGDDLTISIKNIMNDAYAHDVSIKTRSALKVKRSNGDYVGACPIYGYQKSPDNRNLLVVDEDAARVVRDIFRRKLDGCSAKRISEDLNRLGILSPLAYKVSRGLPHPTGGFTDSADAKWCPNTVMRILQDEIYTGTLIQGRQETPNHKIKDLVDLPADEWSRTENAHEAIVSKSDYELVQEIMRLDTRVSPNGDSLYLFSGILICGSCGRNMTRKTNRRNGKVNVYYHCPTGKKHGCTHPVMIREDLLETCILECLQAHIRNIVSMDELLDSICEEQINQELIAGYQSQIAENEAKMGRAMGFKATLYESYITGTLNKADYKDLKERYTAQETAARDAIQNLRREMDSVIHNSSERKQWMKHFMDFQSMQTLDRRAVISMIQSIRVMDKTEWEVTFRFQSEFETTLKHLAQHSSFMPHTHTVSATGMGVV